MASGPLVGGGGGNGSGGNGSREKHRWADNKVYTRKSHKSSSKPNPSSLAQEPSKDDIPKSRIDGDAEKLAVETVSEPPPDESRIPVPQRRAFVTRDVTEGGQHCLTISPGDGTKEEVVELRSMLAEELEMVRSLYRRLENCEAAAAAQMSVVSVGPVTPGYSHSQLSGTGLPRKAMSVPERRQQLSVQTESYGLSELAAAEKEKRTPKANQYYRNTEFVLGKDRLPPPPSTKKSKTNGVKKHGSGGRHGLHAAQDFAKVYAQAFRNCGVLLTRLMKHKHGWVFNTPVDVKSLGLHDYYSIIKHPMDLGTVKSRLSKNWYKSPREFAEDVRLTFQNAMLYNPKGQDVHFMAEELLGIFEERWVGIEADLNVPLYPTMNKKTPPPPLDMRRILERSDSTTHHPMATHPTTHPAMPDITPRSISQTPHSVRTPAMKKPKAKDPHKRDMTYEEKQKLSNNLQNLPPEKLDIIVQIIKKRNSSLSQHDDEIEVDIDSVDAETLWELDRFVTNYKKSLSKHKRKAELAMQARQMAEQNVVVPNLQNQETVVVEKPIETTSDKPQVAPSSPTGEEKKEENECRSSSSCSSSSDSGSSSSDSDSESSSG